MLHSSCWLFTCMNHSWWNLTRVSALYTFLASALKMAARRCRSDVEHFWFRMRRLNGALSLMWWPHWLSHSLAALEAVGEAPCPWLAKKSRAIICLHFLRDFSSKISARLNDLCQAELSLVLFAHYPRFLALCSLAAAKGVRWGLLTLFPAKMAGFESAARAHVENREDGTEAKVEGSGRRTINGIEPLACSKHRWGEMVGALSLIDKQGRVDMQRCRFWNVIWLCLTHSFSALSFRQ